MIAAAIADGLVSSAPEVLEENDALLGMEIGSQIAVAQLSCNLG
jgi:hypothetical protein